MIPNPTRMRKDFRLRYARYCNKIAIIFIGLLNSGENPAASNLAVTTGHLAVHGGPSTIRLSSAKNNNFNDLWMPIQARRCRTAAGSVVQELN
jgi:hypothetical protein